MISKLFLNDICEKSIKRIAGGDLNALSKIYDCAGGLIFSVAFSILNDYQLAQDIMQDTFITIAEKAHTYQGGNAKYWILTISRNLALDTLRKRKNITELNDKTKQKNNSYSEEKIISSIAISDALDKLSQQEKEIVINKIMCDLSHKEIADLMNITVSNSRQKYKRAMDKLRNYYSNEGEILYVQREKNKEKA